MNNSLNLFLNTKISVKLVALHWESMCHLHGEAMKLEVGCQEIIFLKLCDTSLTLYMLFVQFMIVARQIILEFITSQFKCVSSAYQTHFLSAFDMCK